MDSLTRQCPRTERDTQSLRAELAARLAYRGHGAKATVVAERLVGIGVQDAARAPIQKALRRPKPRWIFRSPRRHVCSLHRHPAADEDAAGAWAEQLKSQFDGVEMVLSVVRDAAEQLVSRMGQRGYDVETVDRIVRDAVTDEAADRSERAVPLPERITTRTSPVGRQGGPLR